jgi:L-serine dehydratase
MFLSVFDMFKVGIGPSSSHTMGPMVAAARFLDLLRNSPFHPKGLKASLHGSLAFTGVGHATDRATILGLAGFAPDSYDAARAEATLARIRGTKTVEAPGLPPLAFDPATDLAFDYGPALPGHANGMILKATDAQGDVIAQETYYSIGGGFVLTAGELADAGGAKAKARADVPFPFETAAEMLEMARRSGLSIAAMKRQNELAFRSAADLDRGLQRLWEVMNACIDRGMKGEGILPGGLKVRRRAKGIHDALMAERGLNLVAPHTINDWMSLYAMAVNEENAAGGQVVTAPTNGAAGVVPAVIRYWLDHVPGATPARVGEFLLTAAAIGGLCKHNASISGRNAAARPKSAQPRPWPRPGWRRCWAAPPNRWRMPPRSRWSITWA